MILAICGILLTFILVVGLHEAGHAVAAKLLGVKIQRIAIGFGKSLLTWKDKTGLEWVWAIWPLGGYVHLLNSRIAPVRADELTVCFDKKPIWVRCVILISGVLVNFLIAFVALTFMFMLGYQQKAPLIKTVTSPSIAAAAGLQAGDSFKEIAGQPVNSWQDAGMSLIMALGQKNVAVLVSDTAGKSRKITLNLSQWHSNKEDSSLLSALGIKAWPAKIYLREVEGKPFLLAAGEAIDKWWQLLIFFLIMLKQLITGVIPFSVLLGPLSFLSVSVNSFMQGLSIFLYFIASLSLAVGLINLLPAPGLDGGSLVYAFIEKIRGKPVSVALEILLHRLAVILFSLLLLQFFMNDLRRYFH